MPTPMTTSTPIDLDDLTSFSVHPWVTAIKPQIESDQQLADSAMRRLLADLESINAEYFQKNSRAAFVTIEGRVKKTDSLIRKLFNACRDYAAENGITQNSVESLYHKITDLCGVRFSCPYFDEVALAIEELVRPELNRRGYGTALAEYPDKDKLEDGDEHGYRSYHFFVKVPAPVDIYQNTSVALCEVQARTELQHVWTVKSHDLLYKPEDGWTYSDANVISDMKAVSQSLRAADQFLVSIRDRATGNGGTR